MPFGSLTDFIKYTSDHVSLMATAESHGNGNVGIVIKLLTWNMLNRCHGITDKFSFSNNPFDLNELEGAYQARKQKQLSFLMKQIKTKAVDVLLLQEVDIFTGKNLPEFVSDFMIKSHKAHWGAVHSFPTDNLWQPLLIFYDQTKLEFISHRAIFPRDKDGKNCALEATFRDLKTQETICIVNMHLDYHTNHLNTILQYQEQQIAYGKFTVIGGDTNQANIYITLAGDRSLPTSIANRSKEPEVGALQFIDGFMISPANNDSTATLTPGPRGYFIFQSPRGITTFLRRSSDAELSGKYIFKLLSPQEGYGVVQASRLGLPYVIPEYLHELLMRHSQYKLT